MRYHLRMIIIRENIKLQIFLFFIPLLVTILVDDRRISFFFFVLRKDALASSS